MYKKYMPTRTHATAWPTIATAVVGFGAILAFSTMCIQWGRTSATGQTSRIGSGAKLSEGVVAVATLYPNSLNDDFLRRTKATLLLDKSADLIALLDNGNIVEVQKDEQADYIVGQSRPHGWFIPNTIGVVHFRDSSGSIISGRLSKNIKQIKLSVSGISKSKPITSRIPPQAVFGARMDCTENCPDIDLNDINIQIPHSFSGSDFFSLNIDGKMESLVVLGGKVDDQEISAFAQNILSRSQPDTRERVLDDGIVIQELVPSSNSASSSEGNIISYGKSGDALFTYNALTNKKPITLISSTKRIFSDEGSLSTQSWTNKVCGVNPVYFFALSFSATFAENPNSPLYVARSRNGWRICER